MHVKNGSDIKLIDDGTLDYWRGQGYEPFETGDLVIAPTFAATTPYTAGQLVWNAGSLYRAKADFTSAGSFSAGDWDAAGSGGSGAVPVHKTSAYTAANGDAVLADASGGAFNVTLPAPTSGAKVTVKNVGATGTVTVLPHASETIDGAATNALGAQWMSHDFLSDGTNWLVV